MRGLTHPDEETPSTPEPTRVPPISTPTRASPRVRPLATPQAESIPPSSPQSTHPQHTDPPLLPRLRFDDIVRRVTAFLCAQPHRGLVIPDVAPEIATEVLQYFNHLRVAPARYSDLPPKSLERFRYTYDSSTGNLSIHGMPTKSHYTLAEFFGSEAYLRQLYQTPVFTPAERDCIQPWLSNVALPGSSKRSRSGSNKLGGREKLPNYALVYHPRNGKDLQPVFPQVVMEVGYSQAYDMGESAFADIREWLTATKGGVRLGVLFKIEEGLEQLEEFGDLGDSCDDDDDDDDDEHDSSSDPEDYYRWMANMEIDCDKWVGKFTVFMETWVYDPTTEGPLVSQPRQYLMIDNILVTPMPTLTLTRSTFGLPPLPDLPGENQEFNIDLTPYANKILRSRVQDAFRRKTSWISRRSKGRRCAEGDDPTNGDFPQQVIGKAMANQQEQDEEEIEDGVEINGEGASRQTMGRGMKRFKADPKKSPRLAIHHE